MAIDTVRYRLHAVFDTKTKYIDKEKKIPNPLDDQEYTCPSHFDLFTKLMEYKGKYFESKSIINKTQETHENIDSDDFLHFNYAKGDLKGHFLNTQILRVRNEKETIERNMRTIGTFRLSSSESDINFSVNPEAGFIDFEFSIPKYLYKHNIVQFVPQSYSKHCSVFQNRLLVKSWEHQNNILYDRFIKITKKFFSDIETLFSLNKSINMHYVELLRIDFCFNQYFDSKSEALRYLKMQKKINNKYNSKSNASNKPYDTSLAFTSKSGSYFKIYHKGTEYQQNDLKKHIKLNSEYFEKILKRNKNVTPTHFKTFKEQQKYLIEKAFIKDKYEKIKLPKSLDKKAFLKMNRHYRDNQLFDVKFLQSEADKILRYEVTYRPKQFAYKFKTKHFRRECMYFLEFEKIFKKVRSIEDSRNASKSKRKILKYERDIYNDCKKWLQRSICLTFSDSSILHNFQKQSYGKGITDYDPKTGEYNITQNNPLYKHCYSLYISDVAPLTKDFLSHLFSDFYDMFQHFQVKELENEDDFVQRLKEYNDQADENVIKYNNLNEYRITDIEGNPRYKNNGSTIKKATELLTQKQLREKHLKKINVPILSMLHQRILSGESLDEIRYNMNLSSSTFSRYKKDLEIFGLSRQSQKVDKPINHCDDFTYYYESQTSYLYRESFLSHQNLYRIG